MSASNILLSDFEAQKPRSKRKYFKYQKNERNTKILPRDLCSLETIRFKRKDAFDVKD